VSPDQNPASAGTVPTATMSQRMRSADRLANALVNAATHGWRVDLSDHDADLNTEPILHPILDQAPRVASGIDPHAVRLARPRRAQPPPNQPVSLPQRRCSTIPPGLASVTGPVSPRPSLGRRTAGPRPATLTQHRSKEPPCPQPPTPDSSL
jgi:hypothetical protein